MVQEGWKPSLEVTGQSPLRWFKGRLDNYKGIPGKDAETGREYMSVEFNFTDLEVLESVEPFPFPIATLRMGYSDRAMTRWGGFAKSVTRLVGQGAEIDVLAGKMQEWKMLPWTIRAMNQETKDWEEVEQNVWQVIGLEGAEPPEDLNPHIIDVADGKLDKDIYSVLLQDPRIMSRPNIVQSITDRKLLDTLVDAGLLTRDSDGVFHKVAA